MGQEDVILALERECRPLTPKEIKMLVDISERAIRHSLTVLVKYGEVEKSKSNPIKYSIRIINKK